MGTRYLIFYKKEFENTWPNILEEKLDGLASVDIVQDEYTITYGSVTREWKNLSERPGPSILVCVRYDDGFFGILGTTHYGGIITITANETCNKNKNEVILAKITEILDEIGSKVREPSPKPENPSQ